MVIINAVPAAPDANSYATMDDANAYFEQRLPLPVAWVASGDLEARALLTAARYLDAMAAPLKVFVPPTTTGGSRGYYRTRPQWTGTATTPTQRMAWPRVSMLDRNGNAIDPMVIPLDLKLAQCEFAGQLRMTDTTLTNDVVAQGITAVRAGSVSVNFKENIDAQVWPDAVWNMLVPSWLTDEVINYIAQASFETVVPGSRL